MNPIVPDFQDDKKGDKTAVSHTYARPSTDAQLADCGLSFQLSYSLFHCPCVPTYVLQPRCFLLHDLISPDWVVQTDEYLSKVVHRQLLPCCPIRLAFPVIASVLPICRGVPDVIIMVPFVDFVSSYEGTFLKEALQLSHTTVSYMESLEGKLIDILSRFGCRHIPTPQNIKQLIYGVARHEFLVKPLGAIYALHSGVPAVHHGFWSQFSIEHLFKLYVLLNATPADVIDKIEEPEQSNSARSRVFGYLIRFIGNIRYKELRQFLRFVTGSSVMITKSIKVHFNSLKGIIIARRPISHTCSCTLELPTSYVSFLEFEKEFSLVLASEDAWAMDAI